MHRTENANFTLKYSLTLPVVAAMVFFVVIQSAAIFNMRGVADSQGFNFNSSKALPVNSYEDDAQVSLMHALGYYGPTSNTFDVGSNFGGPLLYGARPIIRIAEQLGYLARFEDRALYALYPGEALRVFKVFAFYKLTVLLIMPLAIFWLLRNYVCARAGEIAAWFVVSIPFLTGFELRLKPDGVVFSLTMLSLLYQIAFAKTGRKGYIYIAVVPLALSFAMKFNMATAVFPFLACIYAGLSNSGLKISWSDSLRLLAKVICLGCLVFIACNPRIVPGALIFADFIIRYIAQNNTSSTSADLLATVWFRMTHFQAFLGNALGCLAIPSLVLVLWNTLRTRPCVNVYSCLACLFILQPFYLWVIAKSHVVNNLTYYYYGQSLLLCVLIALMFSWLIDKFRENRIVVAAMCCAVAIATLLTILDDLTVLRFLCGPSTRQAVHGWFEDNISRGVSVGLPLSPEKYYGFSDRYILDPFRYNILHVGSYGEYAGKLLPEYILWCRSNSFSPEFSQPGYEQIALFDLGRDLPREIYNNYQDDIYSVYKRVAPAPSESSCGPAIADLVLGQALIQEGGQGFYVASYKASGIFPLSITMFLHAHDRFVPLGHGQFVSSLRTPVDPPAYLHQLTPELMTLWGVKYIYALKDDAFVKETLEAHHFALSPEPVSTEYTHLSKYGLYRNNGFRGMAHFLPAPSSKDVLTIMPRWWGVLPRHKLLPYGSFVQANTLPKHHKLVRVRMHVECTGRMDLLLKGAGNSLSLLLGKGNNYIDVPLSVESAGAQGYELNPAEERASADVRFIEISPMAIEPVIFSSADQYDGFANLDAPTDGLVVFSVPYHNSWSASVDGVKVDVAQGPGGTVQVPVSTGKHFVALSFAGARN